MKFLRRAMIGACAMFLSAPAYPQACAPTWIPSLFRIDGPNGRVNALQWFDDGSGAKLYAGGNFQTAGGAVSPNLARWNGFSWETVAGGVGGEVHALAVFNDGAGPRLYVGGSFSSAGGVGLNNFARFDGTTWSSVPGGNPAGTVRALFAADLGAGMKLYAGGDFVFVGTLQVNRIAAWNGGWSALGPGLVGGAQASVMALRTMSVGGTVNLFAGGSFTNAGATAVSNIARWNGSWNALGSGANGMVQALETAPLGVGGADLLFAGGSFAAAGGVSASRVASWNGSAWSALGSGAAASVTALRAYDDGGGPALAVGGAFTIAGGLSASRIARWNGAAWSTLGTGLQCADCQSSAIVTALATDGQTLIAGGAVSAAGPIATPGVARFAAGAWSAYGASTGPSATVLATAAFNDGGGPDLYVAGTFAAAGAGVAARIARFDGVSFTPLGSGVDGTASSLATHDDDGGGVDLYVGGAFANAGGAPAARVARFDGVSWSNLGSGLGGGVAGALALHSYSDVNGPALAAGGDFTTAGGAPAASVAIWRGGLWSALGAGPGGTTRALVSFNDGSGVALYAGGDYGVRKWDGAAWVAVGAGVNGVCRALHVHDDGVVSELHAGGAFDLVGAVAGSIVKKLSGGVWLAVGPTLTGGVVPGAHCLATFDDGGGPKLVVGGQFTNLGATLMGRVARLVGGTWQPLGLGIDLPGTSSKGVFTLRSYVDAFGAALYAGGEFAFINGISASHLGRFASTAGAPGIVSGPPPLTTITEGSSLTLTCVAGGGAPLAYQWFKDGVQLPNATASSLTITGATIANEGYYTCFVTNGCGATNTNSARVLVTCGTLAFFNPPGPLGVGYTIASNRPSTFYFLAISLSNVNVSAPLQGQYSGLFISVADLTLQFGSQALPFVAMTNAFGGGWWQTIPSGLNMQPFMLHGVAFFYDPLTFELYGHTNLASYQIV